MEKYVCLSGRILESESESESVVCPVDYNKLSLSLSLSPWFVQNDHRVTVTEYVFNVSIGAATTSFSQTC